MSKAKRSPQGPWKFEYVASCRIQDVPELVLIPYSVFAHSEEDAQEAMLDLLRDEGGMVALIQTSAMEEV